MIGKALKKTNLGSVQFRFSDVFSTFFFKVLYNKSLKLIKVKRNTFLAVAFADIVWVQAIADAQWVVSV